jgi:hypothetical protein
VLVGVGVEVNVIVDVGISVMVAVAFGVLVSVGRRTIFDAEGWTVTTTGVAGSRNGK